MVMLQMAGFADMEAVSMTLFASLLPSLLSSSIAIDTTKTITSPAMLHIVP
jgi:hypothetical protein